MRMTVTLTNYGDSVDNIYQDSVDITFIKSAHFVNSWEVVVQGPGASIWSVYKKRHLRWM